MVLNNATIGEVVLLYDLGEIYARGQLYGLTVLAVLLVAGFVAFLLSSKLRAVVAAPIPGTGLGRHGGVASRRLQHSRQHG